MLSGNRLGLYRLSVNRVVVGKSFNDYIHRILWKMYINKMKLN